jgi:hypothetical protein
LYASIDDKYGVDFAGSHFLISDAHKNLERHFKIVGDSAFLRLLPCQFIDPTSTTLIDKKLIANCRSNITFQAILTELARYGSRLTLWTD